MGKTPQQWVEPSGSPPSPPQTLVASSLVQRPTVFLPWDKVFGGPGWPRIPCLSVPSAGMGGTSQQAGLCVSLSPPTTQTFQAWTWDHSSDGGALASLGPSPVPHIQPACNRREETGGSGVILSYVGSYRLAWAIRHPIFKRGGQEPLCYDSRLSYPGPPAPSNTPETKCLTFNKIHT